MLAFSRTLGASQGAQTVQTQTGDTYVAGASQAPALELRRSEFEFWLPFI